MAANLDPTAAAFSQLVHTEESSHNPIEEAKEESREEEEVATVEPQIAVEGEAEEEEGEAEDACSGATVVLSNVAEMEVDKDDEVVQKVEEEATIQPVEAEAEEAIVQKVIEGENIVPPIMEREEEHEPAKEVNKAVEIEVEHDLGEREAEVRDTKEVIKVGDDSEEEEDEEQRTLIKRPRSATRTRPREPTPPRKEDTPPEVETSPRMEKRPVEELADDSENERERLRRERKRKRKLLAQLVKKRSKPASLTVMIQVPSPIKVEADRRILEDKEETSEEEK